ncbi:hypothetical protein BH23CHL2_BH23CHL2_36610 [soil metagenome]
MNPDRPLLVIVTGPPASGKTSIAGEIATLLGVPAFHKDDFKERLADGIPGRGLAWSRQLGRVAYGMLFYAGEVLIGSKVSCLLEANFHPELGLPELQILAQGSIVAQIVCSGDPDVLLGRYLARHADGVRHAVHLDRDERRLKVLQADFRRDHRLDLPGLVLRCDTTAAEPVDVDQLVDRIREFVNS